MSPIIDEQGHDKEVKLPLLGLFDDEHIDYEVDRNKDETPNLAELTRRGLEIMESGKYCCNCSIRDVLDPFKRVFRSSKTPRVTLLTSTLNSFERFYYGGQRSRYSICLLAR
jgi:hypothetical protein